MNKLLTTMFGLAVALVTGAAWSQAPAGDAKAGAGKVAMCIGCHGIPRYQASFPEVYKVPKITGQNAAYIASALHAYRKGERKHPSMRAIAEALTDQDIADVAAYYGGDAAAAAAKLDKVPEAPSAVAELLKKGACVSCHGEGFRKPIDPSYPKVAGQYPDYLAVALKSYKIDGNEYVGRDNAIMKGIAKQFSNAELRRIADYISSVDGELKTVPEHRFR